MFMLFKIIWEGFLSNSPELEIYTTTFQETYQCLEQSSVVFSSKLELDTDEWI